MSLNVFASKVAT